MNVKIVSVLILFVLVLLSGGCTSLTVNKSIVPVSGNGWDTGASEVKDIAKIESYGEYGLFGSGAIFHCENNSIIVYPIPSKYAKANVYGFLGIPFIPLFLNAEQKLYNYEIIQNMSNWDGRLYVGLRFYKPVNLKGLNLIIKFENNPEIYSAVESKKSEYNDSDVVVYLYDIMLSEINKFTVQFQSKIDGCNIPDLNYKESSIFVYKPFMVPGP